MLLKSISKQIVLLPILLLPSVAKADSVFLDGNYIKIQLQTAGSSGMEHQEQDQALTLCSDMIPMVKLLSLLQTVGLT